MRRAGLGLAVVALMLMTVPAWADHSVSTGINCSDFAFHEDAQTYFELHPGDPEGLDGPPGPVSTGLPGVACETLPRRGTATTTTTTVPPTIPTTSVPTPITAVEKPPSALLSSSSGEVVGDLGSYCWPNSNSTGACLHVDYFQTGPNPTQALTVTQGEVVTLRFDSTLPVESLRVGVWGRSDQALEAPVANPSRFAVDLAPGTHVLGVDVKFQSPSPVSATASYHFKLQVVQAPPKPSPPAEPNAHRLLALTG